tara:strand:- start:1469 stop:2428 length:960 start_codon:yes stop_codon:yes gene_type:complete
MGLFDSIGKIVSNVGSGIGSFVDTAASFADKLNPLSMVAQGISGLFDNKDSGQVVRSPTFQLDTNPSAYQPPPTPIATTTGTGTGSSNPFAMGFFAPNNQGSGGSLIPRPPSQNQDSIVETSQASIGNILQQAPNIIGLGAQIAKRTAPFFGFGSGQNLKIPNVGDIVDVDQDQLQFNTPTIPRFPMFEEFTTLVNPLQPQMQQMGAGFMSPVLGRMRLSPKGTLIITRKMRSQFKALADNVGLAQASNIAGVPLEIGAMILTKRFPQRSKSISTKKMRDCARTYKQVMQFANMIPKRSATRTTKRATMRGASTVIQNS